MDVFVSDDARRFLQAEWILHSRGGPDGLLLGHRRGTRYVVESVLPSMPGFFSSHEALAACRRHLPCRILGFFTFKPESGKIKKILSPSTYGKLYLEVAADDTERLSFTSYVVEFKDGFYLAPIPIGT